MRFDVLTLFPDMFPGYLGQSLLKRAIDAGLAHSTHIFNAMPRARRNPVVLEPGVLESVLLLDALSTGERADTHAVRALVGDQFTRGHFARAV